MLTRSVFATTFVLLSSSGVGAGLADDPPQAGADVRVERILHEWQRQAAARTSLEVRFTGQDNFPVRGEEPFTGRVVLHAKGQSLVEFVRRDGEDRAGSTERILWANGAMHQLRLERKEHIIWPIATADRDRLPAVLALPFFWHLDAEALKTRYRMDLAKEEAETWTLLITPLSDAGLKSFSRAMLQLDRATYLPRLYVVVSADRKSSKTFRVTESRVDQAVAEEVFAIPDNPGWNVLHTDESKPRAWLLRLLTRNGSAELLP